MIDYGTGSGVLAVGALKFGASMAVGVDVDPLAVKAATANASLNGFGETFTALQCSPTLQVSNKRSDGMRAEPS